MRHGAVLRTTTSLSANTSLRSSRATRLKPRRHPVRQRKRAVIPRSRGNDHNAHSSGTNRKEEIRGAQTPRIIPVLDDRSAEYFTGTVPIDPLNAPPVPARVSCASVTFEPGARSAWHTHRLGDDAQRDPGVAEWQPSRMDESATDEQYLAGRFNSVKSGPPATGC